MHPKEIKVHLIENILRDNLIRLQENLPLEMIIQEINQEHHYLIQYIL